MCDERGLRKEAELRGAMHGSRRDFNIVAISAAAVALLPGSGAARAVSEGMVDIKTADGSADCFFVHPAEGKHPAVMLWPDFMSLRPAYKQMAERLSGSGYSVLAINPYYRGAKSPIVESLDLANKGTIKRLAELSQVVTAEKVAEDARAFVAFLDKQSNVDNEKKMAAIGYCMGGAFTFDTAAAAPDRIGAIAAFHASGLAGTEADSPHLLIPKIRAHALIAIAQSDDEKEPETKEVLRQAFAKAGLPAEVEVYVGTDHGWCTPDMTAYYNEEQARRAWGRLLLLLDRAVR